MTDLTRLPDDLPVPADDGACDHLAGSRIPSLPLASSGGRSVDLSTLDGRVVVFFYPAIGRPEAPLGPEWNAIAGARGCTPQACGFRDRHAELQALGVRVFAVSAQPLPDQQEAARRLALPFELLNDSELKLARAMRLPTFEFKGATLIKRLTLVAVDGRIETVFYPVFPPDRSAAEVVDWLRTHPR